MDSLQWIQPCFRDTDAVMVGVGRVAIAVLVKYLNVKNLPGQPVVSYPHRLAVEDRAVNLYIVYVAHFPTKAPYLPFVYLPGSSSLIFLAFR